MKCFLTETNACQLSGWPQLDGYCVDHFRSCVVSPAMHAMDDATAHWASLCDRVYHVEVAQGLRPAMLHISATRIAANVMRAATRTKNSLLSAEFEDDLDGKY